MGMAGSTSSSPACTRTCGSKSRRATGRPRAASPTPRRCPAGCFPRGRLASSSETRCSRTGAADASQVSDSVGAETYWPWGPSVDDFNADGWDDIFIAASMNFPYRYGINSLLLNEGGHHFLPSEFVLGVEPRPIRTQQVWFTLECQRVARGHPFCAACAHPEATAGACRIDAA